MPGGFNPSGFIPKEERADLYRQIADELSQVDDDGVEIVIQTMPPFPWHFGGQSYHNLFVDADEIVEFCKTNESRICLDISHSKMACNYYGWDFCTFIQKVGEYTAHMHISDALGNSGEGVKMGEGDIDFIELGSSLNKHVPEVQFIPEIWQGHKNSGAEFWSALAYLENKL